jgi:hypothetical protein
MVFDFEDDNHLPKLTGKNLGKQITGIFFISRLYRSEDTSEREAVAIGTLGGTILIWDLHSQKSKSL